MLHIGVLQFVIEIPWSRSLKDKRSIVKSIKEKSRRRFNISIAEFGDDLDNPATATLGAVMAGNDSRYIAGALDKFLASIRGWPDATLVDSQLEIL